ncbi:MAG TPA: hypothetical protein VFB12_26720, partial [Ktedonobacteraceae bacterium]|nr:hypothetical protein [Ktedonobacteraceae bacterium]
MPVEDNPQDTAIVANSPNGLSQLATVIPIAWPTKRPEKLMRMRLEYHRAGAYHFSPLASQIPWRTN